MRDAFQAFIYYARVENKIKEKKIVTEYRKREIGLCLSPIQFINLNQTVCDTHVAKYPS